MVTNLVNNAIKHNHTGGKIDLLTTAEELSLSNTGGKLISAPERLFERFKKDASGPESVGLGLAIIKQICDSYGLQVNYTETDGLHRFCVSPTSF